MAVPFPPASWCCAALILLAIFPCAAVADSEGPHGRTVLRRSRRTLDSLCGSEQFVNAVARTLMDESRPLLASTEPLVLGEGPEWRGVRFSNGRLWGASTVHLRERVLLRCDSTRMAVALHVALNNSELAYDWEAPEALLGTRGSVSLFARQMSLKCVVVMPRKFSGGSVQVAALRITTLRGADVTVAGPRLLAPLMSAAANLLLKHFPDQAATLLSRQLKDGLQRYLDEQLVGLH